METQFLLTNYFNDPLNTIKNLYDNHNIMSKDYSENNMTILYNKYNTKHKTKLELECRSVIIDRTTRKIICYSCSTPIYNNDATKYIKYNKIKIEETDVYICYEGSLLSVFNYNEKWYVATRKCIYNNESEKTGKYKMFLDVLEKDGYDFISFTNTLDTSKSYNFVLIHHLNENIVDYKSQFGNDYTKLCFISARNSDMSEIKLEEVRITLSPNIFLPAKLDMSENVLTKDINSPTYEGIIIKIKQPNMPGDILKIQTQAFQFYKAIGSDKNMLRGFLFLYQNNTLNDYFTNNPDSDKFKKLINPLNTNETFDIIGIISSIFKVLANELFELYKILYDFDGNQEKSKLSGDLYKCLSADYKNIIFKIRGLFLFSKKKQIEVSLLDITRILKTFDVKHLENLIKERKLMLNWSRIDKSIESFLFQQTLYKCDKICYKLASIYTIKLFPEIMPTDVPKL